MKIKTRIANIFISFWIKIANKLLLALKKLLYNLLLALKTPVHMKMSSPVTLCVFPVIYCGSHVSPCTPCDPLSALVHIPCVPLSPPVLPCKPLYFPVYVPKIPCMGFDWCFYPLAQLVTSLLCVCLCMRVQLGSTFKRKPLNGYL